MIKNVAMTFTRRLKKLMGNMKQKDLAAVVGGGQSTISNWLNGKSIPPSDIVEKIAEYFGVTTDYLLKGSGEQDEIVNISFYQKATGSNAQDDIPIPYSFVKPYAVADIRAVKVYGDSMIKLHIFPGDIVFFVPEKNPSDGLYVLSSDEEDLLFVKRLEFDLVCQEIKVISENDHKSSTVIKGDDRKRFRVIGRVIAWITRHPY